MKGASSIEIEEQSSAFASSSSEARAATFKGNLQHFQFLSTRLAGSPPQQRSDATDIPAYKLSRKRPLSEHGLPQDAESAPTTSPRKKQRTSSKYVPPAKYAHLPKLLDVLEPDLICVFVGTNPGIRTATSGHSYAHPSNLFWKLLHSSGCTDVRLPPAMDVDLPKLYCMGNTNIVERASRDTAELSKAEMAAGTPILEEKVRKFRPEVVCIVGKCNWEAIWRWRYKREIRKSEFAYGWQDDRERLGKVQGKWDGARVFVACSTSGLSASLRPHEKEAIWKPLGEWVKMRRMERFGTEGRIEHGLDDGCTI